MNKLELRQLIKEEITHYLQSPSLQKLNKIMFNLYDGEKITKEEYSDIQSILKDIDKLID
jgi:hypothetical protein